MREILSLIGVVLITCIMVYQVIVRELWSLKISALFVVILGLAVTVNIIKIMYDNKRDRL